MTIRIGLVIVALTAAGLLAGAVLYRKTRSRPDDISSLTDDEVAPPAAEETAPAEAEPASV